MGLRALSGKRPVREPAIILAMLAVCALVMFVGRAPPVILWDEGRVVVNALEMRARGFGIVTTYNFEPDTWNTKPPLLVWLMTGSMALFGPSLWAARLPSVLAAMGTLLLVASFLYRVSKSLPTALLGMAVLATSVGFFGEHGARTGDYDALLCFFTTAYLMILFFAVHRRRPPARYLIIAAAMGAGALMTKAIAGAMPGAGLLLYLVITGRWRRPLQTPAYVLAAACAVLPLVALFAAVAATAPPSYLSALLLNDIRGRFAAGGDGHLGPPWYYFDIAFRRGMFSFGAATLLAVVALRFARGRTRQGLIFALCIALGQLAAISMASVKLAHYCLPIYPFLAIAVALAVHAALRMLAARRSEPGSSAGMMILTVRFLVAVLLVHALVLLVYVRRSVLPEREENPAARYGVLIDALPDRNGPVLLFDRGVGAAADDAHFQPQLRFYLLQARERGLRVEHVADDALIRNSPRGAVLGSCDPHFVRLLRRRGADIAHVPDCVAVRQAA